MAKPALSANNLFSALPAELTRGLFEKARIVSLDADQTAFIAGDDGDGCYRVEEGLLKVSVVASGGGERILAILGPGSLVGELSMIDGAPRSASVCALRPSKLSFVSRATFEAFGRSNPEVYRHVMTLLARRLRETNGALAATSFLSVKGRVARALLSLAEAFGHDVGGGRILVRQKLTQSDLGAMAGIARENVSRILKDWTDRKLVSRLAGYYCLENKAAIGREASSEPHRLTGERRGGRRLRLDRFGAELVAGITIAHAPRQNMTVHDGEALTAECTPGGLRSAVHGVLPGSPDGSAFMGQHAEAFVRRLC